MRRKFFEAAWLFVLLAAAVAFLTETTVGQELLESPVTGVVDVCELNPAACMLPYSVGKSEPLKCTDGEITYGHDWKPSAWIIWDDNLEVPDYYPPAMAVRVEVCSRCGFLRVPPESLKEVVEKGR